MALSHGESSGNGQYPTHYLKPVEGGEFAVETKIGGAWQRLKTEKPIRIVEGDLESIGMWSATYKSGKYQGQEYHVLAIRVTDGDDRYQINTHATSVAGTCLASYLSALSTFDRVYIGVLADDDDPKMVKLYVKKRKNDDPMGELIKLTPIPRTGLKGQGDRLAYCAMQYGASEITKFDPRPENTEQGAGEPGVGSAIEELQATLSAKGYPALDNINYTVYAPVFQKIVKGMTRIDVYPDMNSGYTEMFNTDTFRVIAEGLRKVWTGEPTARPQGFWIEDANLTALRMANTTDEYDPFADGAN